MASLVPEARLYAIALSAMARHTPAIDCESIMAAAEQANMV